jgi:hypothetical protein
MDSGCKCEPGRPCAEHNAYNKSPVVATGEAGFGNPQLTVGEKKRVFCKLCSSEGVEGTVLCREHLQGYMLAVEKLRSSSQMAAKNYLIKRIKE